MTCKLCIEIQLPLGFFELLARCAAEVGAVLCFLFCVRKNMSEKKGFLFLPKEDCDGY